MNKLFNLFTLSDLFVRVINNRLDFISLLFFIYFILSFIFILDLDKEYNIISYKLQSMTEL